jgi:two-component system sensor histidine kinase KdpD
MRRDKIPPFSRFSTYDFLLCFSRTDCLQMRVASARPALGYVSAIAGVLAATLLLIPFRDHINSTTTSLVFLLVVLLAAILFGSRPALVASVMAALSFNYFFLPPYYTLTIAEPQNWVALIAFLAVALTVGQLSANARARAEMAEDLYKQLQDAFEQASEAEAVKKSEKLKSALLDAVTHDLRTPLTSIKAATTMLIDENSKHAVHRTLDPERSADLLEVINEETDRLNTFVESMVELARIEAGDLNWPQTTVAVDEIVTGAVRRAVGIVGGRHMNIDIEPELPLLNVDARSISEVIFNLIDNAVKYSPDETPIEITARRVNGKVEFAVQDQGPGIAQAERENVFQKFYRRDNASKGFGLGLAIARGIVEAHGGHIRIGESAAGCRVVFEIPVDTANE